VGCSAARPRSLGSLERRGARASSPGNGHRAILGCRYGSSRPQHDIALYAELYRRGQLLLDELVTETYPVEDFAKAADDVHHGRVARGVLTF
jgi:Zn-dependent alcohol dehydrogenase